MEEILITSGFYKYNNSDLLYGPNFVLNLNYQLNKNDKDSYIYPIDGWYWFDSKEEAYSFFNIENNQLPLNNS